MSVKFTWSRLRELVEARLDAEVEFVACQIAINRNGSWGGDFCQAYRGSLDAAKRVHDELAPRTTRAVDATEPQAGIRVDLYGSENFSASGEDEMESRAWLLALIATQEVKEQSNSQSAPEYIG